MVEKPVEVIKYVDRELVKVVEKPVEVIKHVDRDVVKVVEGGDQGSCGAFSRACCRTCCRACYEGYQPGQSLEQWLSERRP